MARKYSELRERLAKAPDAEARAGAARDRLAAELEAYQHTPAKRIARKGTRTSRDGRSGNA